MRGRGGVVKMVKVSEGREGEGRGGKEKMRDGRRMEGK